MKNCKFQKLKVIFFVLFYALSNSVVNANIINGDFDTKLNGWNDASSNGLVQWDNNQAYFSTGSGSDLFSAVLVQGDDGFFNFSNPILIDASNTQINFNLSQVSQITDTSETGFSSFSDSFNFSIYDSLDLSYDIFFSDLLTTTSNQLFSFDLSSLVGRSVAFSFELTDEDDGFNTTYALDNIELTSSINQVPEPDSILLFLLSFIIYFNVKSQRKNNI